MVKSVTVRAPCSTANLGPGFDVFGMALDAFYDEVTVTKKGKSIKIVSSDDIPLDPKKNTAGLVAKAMLEDIVKDGYTKYKGGIEIKIKKNVPAGYGMGSSAASAAACAIAMNQLFGVVYEDSDLTYFAGIGERASAGTVHYDNVAASLYGGFVVVDPRVNTKGKFVNVTSCDVSQDITMIVAVPKIEVPKQKTKASRGVIPRNVKFSDASINLGKAAYIAANFAMGNADFAIAHMEDIIVEPARKKMIPGFDKVKKNAMKAGASSCTISGAGPSVIAFVENWFNKKDTERGVKEVGEAMKKGFKSAKTDCEIIICKASKGPEIAKIVK